MDILKEKTTISAIDGLPDKVKSLGKPPDTIVLVTVSEIEDAAPKKDPKQRFPFLFSGEWEGDAPSDLAENHDHYLSDENS